MEQNTRVFCYIDVQKNSVSVIVDDFEAQGTGTVRYQSHEYFSCAEPGADTDEEEKRCAARKGSHLDFYTSLRLGVCCQLAFEPS
jgi:hypothetical protein